MTVDENSACLQRHCMSTPSRTYCSPVKRPNEPMRPTRHHRSKRGKVNLALRAIVVSLVALACWMMGSGFAGAHTALTDSDPAKDATLTAPPTAITLTFSEDLNPAFANVVVNGVDGRNWISDPPRVDGPKLSASVRTDLPGNGVYTVAYRVVSADGHPVSGSFAFTVAGAPVTPRPATTTVDTSPSTTTAEPEPQASAGSDTKTTVLSAGAAGLAIGGAIAFWQSRRHRRSHKFYDEPPSSDAQK